MGVERVEVVIAPKPEGTIPDEFIASENEQPGITTVHGRVLEVPTIDFSDPDEQKLIRQIAEASSNWGMYQIVNHDIPSEAITNLQAVGKEFFELPPEEKEAYAKPLDSDSMEGYGTKLFKEFSEGDVTKKSWVDHMFNKIWPPSVINYQFWPKNPPSYREANEEYAKHMQKVVEKLFRLLSLGLGLEGQEIKKASGGDDLIYLLKINYYPPCPRPDLALGVVAHTDMSVLTILVPNEVQGLQASKDGHWYDVRYIPNALVIHIGDQMEVMSNGKYKSVLHRTTVNKDQTRISWPVFLEPPADQVIGPLPQLVNQENPPKYKTKTYGEFVYCKLNNSPQ